MVLAKRTMMRISGGGKLKSEGEKKLSYFDIDKKKRLVGGDANNSNKKSH